MSNKSSSGSSGIGFLSVLGIVFVVLKLTGNITWSWWLVLLPLYGGVALIVVILLALISIALYKS